MSTLKVNKLRDTAGSADAIVLDPNGGAVLAGVTTMTTARVTSGIVTNTFIVGAGVTISESGIDASGIGITCANINGTKIGGRRNLIINGAMNVAQRGTSFSPSSTDQIYTLDRFQHVATSGAAFDATVTLDSSTPVGFLYSYKVTPDNADTPSGGGNACIRTKIEGQNAQDLAYGGSDAKKVTVSFYAKSASQNNGQQYTFQLRHFATDGTQRSINAPFTITSSFQRFTFTFEGDTAADIIGTSALGMELDWQLAAGPDDITSQQTTWTTTNLFTCVTGQSNFLDSTSNEFYLTGVQLEVGTQVTAFEHRSFPEELALCQRYYWALGTTIYGCAYGSSIGFVHYSLPVTMRATGTLTYSGIRTTSSFYDYSSDQILQIQMGATNPYISNPALNAEL